MFWHWELLAPMFSYFLLYCTNTRKPSSCRTFQCTSGFCPAQQHRHHASSFSSFMLDGEVQRHRNFMSSLASMGLVLKFLKPVSPGILNPYQNTGSFLDVCCCAVIYWQGWIGCHSVSFSDSGWQGIPLLELNARCWRVHSFVGAAPRQRSLPRFVLCRKSLRRACGMGWAMNIWLQTTGSTKPWHLLPHPSSPSPVIHLGC